MTNAGIAKAVSGDELSTLDLFERSIEADFDTCVDFEVKGACEWIKCTLFGCSFETTTVIQHYSPDVIVSVYDVIGDSPYSDSDIFTEALSSALVSNTAGGENASISKPTNVISRHVDIYGSSAAYGLINLLSNLPLGLACEPRETVLQPYFVSAFNPWLWYTGFVDSLVNIDQSLEYRAVTERLDGNQGSLISPQPLWGNIFPRSGMVVSQDHFRASAAFAARAMDIVLNGNAIGHFTNQLSGSEGEYYQPSQVFEEWSSYEGRWQMLYPNYENQCHILGDSNYADSMPDGWAYRRSDDGDYAWHYWRRKKCCKRPSGYSLLFKVEW